MGWGFRHMQGEAGEGGSVYLRLSTRALDQPQRIMAPELQRDITEGASGGASRGRTATS